MQTTSRILSASWEYLLPMKKERMAGYIRFSDPSTPLDDGVMESQARAIREYGEKEGYAYNPQHEYREAISAYTVPYIERKTLLEVIEAAKRKEFDVLVVTEVRSISRRTVEVFVIYDLLQKYGVRFETISEKFEDSAVGHLILSARAFSAEVERENTYARLQRGKKHRLQNGSINGHNKSAYGLVFIDTQREVKGAYALNTAIVHAGSDEKQWTEPMVIAWMNDRLLEGWSVRKIAFQLTEMGILCPNHTKKVHGIQVSTHWHPSTVYAILTNRIYIGEVWANRFKKVENPKTKRLNMMKRPQDEWVLLPEGTAPPIISKDVFDAVQKQLAVNRVENIRNNKASKEMLGLVRAGYARCGICGRTLNVLRRGNTYNGHTQIPQYSCNQRFGRDDLLHNHNTSITLTVLDKAVRQKIRELVLDPAQVRKQVTLRRQVKKPAIDAEDVKNTIDNIQAEIDNLFELARHATNDSTRKRLGLLMEDLENRQREAEALLVDIDEDDDDRQLLEDEIVKFEKWVHAVRPDLGNPEYLKDATYDELRLAVRILGIRAVVYPKRGEYPFRFKLTAGPPEIMKYLDDGTNVLIQQSIE